MDATRCCIRIAMLNADTSVPNTYGKMGTFGDILQNILASAASRVSPELSIQHSVFDVVCGEYPTSPSDFDAVIITASAASSYDDEPWIRTLEQYLVTLYHEHPQVKMFGSCFGHHIVCQALLRDSGLKVAKHPDGWDIGVSGVELTDEFIDAVGRPSCGKRNASDAHQADRGRLPSPPEARSGDGGLLMTPPPSSMTIPRRIRLQFVHADHVVVPAASAPLPSPWVLLGSTPHCYVQGVYSPGRVLTLQGHFEFDKFESRETMRIFGAEGGHAVTGASGAHSGASRGTAREAEDDGELVAEMMVRFLMSEYPEAGRSNRRAGGFEEPLTPRGSMEID